MCEELKDCGKQHIYKLQTVVMCILYVLAHIHIWMSDFFFTFIASARKVSFSTSFISGLISYFRVQFFGAMTETFTTLWLANKNL